MRSAIHVVTPARFHAWIASQVKANPTGALVAPASATAGGTG
jgi:heme/copper-type cytochrome/quinol oxidase subunit 2